MEQIGKDARFLRIRELVQVTHIVAVVEEKQDDSAALQENELILASNRRPIPIPYSEEP